MKSHMRPALRAMPAVRVQISMPLQGVLRDVCHAVGGFCIDVGQRVLDAMMEADRVAVCGAKGVPDEGGRATPGGCTASRVVLGGTIGAHHRRRSTSARRLVAAPARIAKRACPSRTAAHFQNYRQCTWQRDHWPRNA